MTNTKTITRVTRPDGTAFTLRKHRNGWPVPSTMGGAWVNGTGAYDEACERWREEGCKVSREPNPAYKPRNLFFR